jgi:alkylation response protein AidB-like acyl-CoA dehydrogenase
MIGFEPSEEQKFLRDAVAQFAERSLRPRMRDFERARALPDDVLDAAHAMGFAMAAFPESVGGAGLGLVTQVLVEEELAHGDPAAPFALSGPGAFGWAALHLGGPEAGKKTIAPFLAARRTGAIAWGEKKAPPERAGLSTTAERTSSGWRLRGEKAYVVNADRAQAFVVFAQADASAGWAGLGAFVVPRETRGLRVLPRYDTLGLQAVSFGGVALDDVEIADDARLAHGGDPARLVSFFAVQGLVAAARGVGLARAAFEVTRDYCEQRRAFGKPIGHFQAVAFTLADRNMDLAAARAMCWRAAWLWDSLARGDEGATERDALLHTAWAVSFAHEAAMRAGDDAVQLHGGSGFMRDYPVEKWMRDAKQLQLCGLTAEHADQIAAAVALGNPVDPALALPSADSQNVFV